MTIRSFSLKIAKDKTAATAVEYGLILGLIVIAILVAISGVAHETIGMWNKIYSKSDAAISGS
jgi:pilus assembly protein Flp/PilA